LLDIFNKASGGDRSKPLDSPNFPAVKLQKTPLYDKDFKLFQGR